MLLEVQLGVLEALEEAVHEAQAAVVVVVVFLGSHVLQAALEEEELLGSQVLQLAVLEATGTQTGGPEMTSTTTLQTGCWFHDGAAWATASRLAAAKIAEV